MKKITLTKKQMQYGGIALLILLAIVCAILFAMQGTKKPAVLSAHEAHLEYGDPIESIQNDVLEGDLLENITYDTSNVIMDEALGTPACGSYEVEVFDGENSLGTVTVYVNDTTRPEFEKAPETIQVDEGFTGDILSYFEAQDLSGVTLQAKTDEIDFFTPGAYQGSVTAVDGNGNEKTVLFTLQVIEGSGTINVSLDTGTVKDGILIVNKKNPLPDDYDPGEDPQAAQAVRELIAGMKNAGLDVSETYSGFRTYNSQKQLYENYVLEQGTAQADTFSARPGYSEHQSGLAFDLRHTDGSLLEKEAEAKWLEENAAAYGFIIRYPSGKEEITGYRYEPWHLRYIGERASEIKASGKTLEEFLEVEGGDYQ